MNQSDLNDFISHPSESLSVEIKSWISPKETAGICKIVRACLALRNRGGGFLLIGFNDRTLLPDPYSLNEVREKLFHVDLVQEIVSRFANDSFEISVRFGVRDGQAFPVIGVPPGVVVPVAAKRDLKDENNQNVICVGDVYFRTLASNGRPSTSKARPNDWKTIVEVCFENREADIGRFLRRHLGGSAGQADFLASLPDKQINTLKQRATELLADGLRRAQSMFSNREKDCQPPNECGTWSVALVVEQERLDALPSRDFLQTVAAANPNYTGWPIWLDSRGFSDPLSRPVNKDKGWEAAISSSRGWSRHYDFMRFDPMGKFYLWRVLQDDLTDKVTPRTALDPIIVLLRVTEAIAVGLAITRACGWPSDARLGFAFEWTGLRHRHLESWANPLYSAYSHDEAFENSIQTYIEVPNNAPLSAIAPFLKQATRELFVVFGGYELPERVFEDWARKLVDRDFT